MNLTKHSEKNIAMRRAASDFMSTLDDKAFAELVHNVEKLKTDVNAVAHLSLGSVLLVPFRKIVDDIVNTLNFVFVKTFDVRENEAGRLTISVNQIHTIIKDNKEFLSIIGKGGALNDLEKHCNLLNELHEVMMNRKKFNMFGCNMSMLTFEERMLLNSTSTLDIQSWDERLGSTIKKCVDLSDSIHDLFTVCLLDMYWSSVE